MFLNSYWKPESYRGYEVESALVAYWITEIKVHLRRRNDITFDTRWEPIHV